MTTPDSLWATFEASERADVKAMAKELQAAFRAWARLAEHPLAEVTVAFVGADVAPYVPSDAWAAGRGKDGAQLFRDASACTPQPLAALCDALRELEDEGEDDAAEAIFDALTEKTRALTIERFGLALEVAVKSAAFKALPRARPFRVLVSPGHDQGKREVLVA